MLAVCTQYMGLYLSHSCIPKSNDRLFVDHWDKKLKNTLVVSHQNLSLNQCRKHERCIIRVIFLIVLHYTLWIMFPVCATYWDIFQVLGNTLYRTRILCGYDTLIILMDIYSLSGKTSYRQISWSLEAARLDGAMVVSLWNSTGTSAAALLRYLPNFRAIEKV